MLVDHIGIPQLRDMAARSDEIAGEIGIDELPRLKDLLYPDEGARGPHIDARFRFRSGVQGYPEVSGTASGALKLKCQRCLGSMDWPLELSFQLAVVGSEADTEEVAEPFDTLVAGEHGIQLAEVLEDEVLSSLPLAPAHEQITDCHDAELLETRIVDEQADFVPAAAASETNHPFEGLADMLKHAADKKD